MTELYDPLTYGNLMTGLVTHFEKQQPDRLDDMPCISGPGVYSLSYTGGLDVYGSIRDSGAPIYVGKAVPKGARKGSAHDPKDRPLQRRICGHLKSVHCATNLDAGDFLCRHLAVEPVWITLAERFLIDHYKPVWNMCLDGFGNNTPGKGRGEGKRSWWDTLHPGRAWAQRLPTVPDKTQETAEKRVRGFFADAAIFNPA